MYLLILSLRYKHRFLCITIRRGLILSERGERTGINRNTVILIIVAVVTIVILYQS